MGLRCSVLGHRYGERERVEERDDQGSEILHISREIKTCERCGETLLITENKEITHAHTPPEPSSDPQPRSAPDPEPELAEPVTSDDDDDGLILPNEPTDREPGEWPADPEPETSSEEQSDTAWPEPPDDPQEDPDKTDDESADQAWPDIEEEADEGFDATVGDHDDEDEILEAIQTESQQAVEITESGFARAAPIDAPDDSTNDEVRTEYYCPQCEWKAKSLVASVRRGDICPSCKKGYVAERNLH